jgi:hypothetical protein
VCRVHGLGLDVYNLEYCTAPVEPLKMIVFSRGQIARIGWVSPLRGVLVAAQEYASYGTCATPTPARPKLNRPLQRIPYQAPFSKIYNRA